MSLTAEDLTKILDAVAPRAEFKGYDCAWRVNGRLVQVERKGEKFRICVYWPKDAKSSWLIAETALKRLTAVVPEIATKLADPTVDFSKDK